ncbi:hypothetical protein CDL12_28870 [Handroanthus impetiginosus]|uniref:Homeobox domain-containing protein n=1 Tax=Handroanthus impetiginosus TaxID=429701 RepID=A0A2G9G167_9LAMI|nr:hypothetical protein CDL12_28870 [Handroanthus impetiginosus]
MSGGLKVSERAVSILRAWLFDHCLHLYPTDTDKHILATQTGLTRNQTDLSITLPTLVTRNNGFAARSVDQVSKWFINARVRLWKRMVEEKRKEWPKLKLTRKRGSYNQANDNAESLNMSPIPDKEVECSRVSPSEQEFERTNSNIWNQEKRSRIECQDPSMLDGSFMGLVPSLGKSKT